MIGSVFFLFIVVSSLLAFNNWRLGIYLMTNRGDWPSRVRNSGAVDFERLQRLSRLIPSCGGTGLSWRKSSIQVINGSPVAHEYDRSSWMPLSASPERTRRGATIEFKER